MEKPLNSFARLQGNHCEPSVWTNLAVERERETFSLQCTCVTHA